MYNNKRSTMKFNKLFFVTIASFLLLFSCKTLKNTQLPFQIKDASYYMWFLNEDERGTNISIELSTFPKNIVFEAVVFEGVKLPVAVAKDTDKCILNAAQTAPLSKLKTEQQVAKGENRLIYTQNGKQKAIAIKEFRREKTVYYNK